MSRVVRSFKVCIVCGKNWSSGVTCPDGKKVYEKWYSGPTCNGCYNRVYGKKRITFLGKRIYLKGNPRKGYCSLCGNTSLDGDTHIHHKKYDRRNPLKHTVELCPQCHGRYR